jgi:DNA-binding MarR family transcriptional regulator
LVFNHRKSTTYALTQTARAYRARLSQQLSNLKLYPGQDQILKALAEKDGQTMGELANELAVKPPTVTKMVARLGTQGLVERRRSSTDGRSSSVFLTDKGRALIGDLDALLRTLDTDAIAAFDPKDLKRLRKALRSMLANLQPDSQPELPVSSDNV